MYNNIYIYIYTDRYHTVLIMSCMYKHALADLFSAFASVVISYGRLPLAKLYFRLCHFCFWNKGKSFHCSVVAGTICQQSRLPFSIRHHLLQILRDHLPHDIVNIESTCCVINSKKKKLRKAHRTYTLNE